MSGLAHFKAKLKFPGNRFKLAAHKTYIIPTGFGLAFALLSFVLLVMAIGYGNNVLYFFVFLLVSMGLSATRLTNNNIEELKFLSMSHGFIFAQEKNNLQLSFENKKPQRSQLFDIEINIETNAQLKNEIYMLDQIKKSNFINISWSPLSRGLTNSPRLKLQSKFPFKLLSSWKYYDDQNRILIYPERKGQLGFLSLIDLQARGDEKARQDTDGLFRDHREFQSTDSPSRIDWKQSAKHRKHLIKNYEKSGERKILIDWEMTQPAHDLEDRICQLALWVDLAHKNNENYSLKICQDQTEYGLGLVHYKKCLDKLAFLQESDVLS